MSSNANDSLTKPLVTNNYEYYECLVFSIQLFIAYKYDNAINKRSDYLTDPFNAYSMPH